MVKKVEVRVTKNCLEVFHNNTRIASHLRSIKQYAYSTNESHMPPRHKKYSFWTLENILRRARDCGTKTEELIKHIIKTKIHPLQGFRPAQGIIRLSNKYSSQRLDNACSLALQFGFTRVSQIHDILKNKKDISNESDNGSVKNKENIRGKKYYQENEEIS